MNYKTFRLNDEVVYVMNLIMFKSMKTFSVSNSDAEFWFGLEDINGFLQFEGFMDKMADFITLLHKYSFMFDIYCGINERLKVML